MSFNTIPTNCTTGKTSYPTGLDATSAAEWAANRGLGPRWPYLCRHCDQWHVTSRPPGTPAGVDHHAGG